MLDSFTRKLTLLAATLTVVSCGGGGAGGGGTNGLSGSTVATVIVEERSGKTMLDAWFEDGATAAFNTNSASQTLDTCVVNPQPARLRAPVLVREATQINVVNRTGTIVSLIPNQVNASTVYSTDVRWLSSRVSDDASIEFESSSRFQSIGTVSLPTLSQLRWIAPADGKLNSANDNLQWEPSSNANTVVKINLSAADPDSLSGASTVVICYVADDGQFQLDAATKQRLDAVGGTVVMRAQRVRTQAYQAGDATLNVVQISHGRDA